MLTALGKTGSIGVAELTQAANTDNSPLQVHLWQYVTVELGFYYYVQWV